MLKVIASIETMKWVTNVIMRALKFYVFVLFVLSLFRNFCWLILFIIIIVSFVFRKLQIDWYEEAHRPRDTFTSRLLE